MLAHSSESRQPSQPRLVAMGWLAQHSQQSKRVVIVQSASDSQVTSPMLLGSTMGAGGGSALGEGNGAALSAGSGAALADGTGTSVGAAGRVASGAPRGVQQRAQSRAARAA